ncbi:hypothetical protein AgCh_036209 [Apium graveolens]
MDYKNYKVEIKTADAHDSMKNGVILLVTGYVDENVPVDANTISVSAIPDTPSTGLTKEPGSRHISNSDKSYIEELPNVEEKNDDLKGNESTKAVPISEPQSTENHIIADLDPVSCNPEEDAPKKSYASIVSSHTKKGNLGSVKMYVPATSAKVAPLKNEKPSLNSISQALAPATSVPNAPSSSNGSDEGVQSKQESV